MWGENDLEVIDRACKEQPAAYLRAFLSLAPKDFAMTVERDVTPQHIEISFVCNPQGTGQNWSPRIKTNKLDSKNQQAWYKWFPAQTEEPTN